MQKQTISFVATLLLVTFLFGTIVGSAQTPTTTTYLNPGSLSTTADYVIWRDGSYYFSRNGETGQVTSSTNCSYIIQTAYDNLPNNRGTIYLKQGGTSAFHLDTQIQTNSGQRQVWFIGSGWGNESARLAWYGDADAYMFNFTGPSTEIYMENIDLDGNDQGRAIWLNSAVFVGRNVRMLRSSTVPIAYFNGTGTNVELYHPFIEDTIYISSQVNFFNIYGGTIYKCHLYGTTLNTASLHVYGTTFRYLKIDKAEWYNIALYGCYFDPVSDETENLYVGNGAYVHGFSAYDCVFNGGTTYSIVMDQARAFTLYNPLFINTTGSQLMLTSNSLNGRITLQDRQSTLYADSGTRNKIELIGQFWENHGVEGGVTDAGVYVAHGLSVEPTVVQVTGSLGGDCWVTSKNSTHFFVDVETGWTETVYWSVFYQP